MNANGITRASFKNNFLKHIIMRLDFQGVMQTEMEGIIVIVKKYLKDNNFSRYEEKIGNEIELNVGPNIFNMQEPVKEVRQTKIYSFYNDDTGYAFDLSASFVILKVNATKYASFEEYSKLFIDICNVYGEKIDFFTVKRFGLRKINFCFLKDISLVCKYFEGKYYSCQDLFPNAQIVTNVKQTNLIIDQYRLNISYVIEQGQIQDNIMYKVILDSDIYIEQEKIIQKLLFEDKNIKEMNEELFKIYVDSITSEMANLLMRDIDDIPENLLGVDSNE